MGLLESLEEDIKAANLNTEGEPNDGQSTEDGGSADDGYEPDTGKSRERIAGRRAARNSGAPSQDKDGASQNDGGTSRGSRGTAQGSGEGAHEDAQAPQGADGAPQGGEGGLDADKPLSPKEEAYHRRKQRESDALITKLQRDLEDARKVSAPPAPAATELKAAVEPAKTGDNPEPDKEKDLAGWLVWNAEEQRNWRAQETQRMATTQREREVNNLVQAAREEISTIESNYRKTNPDYDNALTHAKTSYTQAVKLLAPHMTDAQVAQALDKELFQIALKCNREGTNFGDTVYDLAIERFGYDPDNGSAPARQRPNLRVVTNNKRRSASSLEGGGQRGAGRISMEAASQMSPAELNALSADDWSYLESQGF